MSEPWHGPVDLDNCDREPIHIPGAVQPHGALVAVTQPELVVRVVSANLAAWCGVEPEEAVGRPLASVLGADAVARIQEAARAEWVERIDEIPLALPGRAVVAA